MATTLSAAADGSTYIVTAAFTDEADAAVVPDSITWTLTDADGTVVNSREAVAVVTPAASYDIVLAGADLLYSTAATRVLTVEATYTSDAGAGLPLKAACRFVVEDLVAV